MNFPYQFRESQKEMLEAMVDAAHGGHLVVEAGTGIGKTICALFAAGSEALQSDKTVLYLVRTNSQQRQVILEARRLRLATVPLQGRRNLCILLRSDEEFRSATSEELSMTCNDRKMRTLRGERGCPYYARLLAQDRSGLGDWVMKDLPTAEEIFSRCSALGVCPYEFIKETLPDAKAVVAPYIYFFDRTLRGALLRWMNLQIADTVLVVDEAHNLPDYARGLGSARLSLGGLRIAKTEIEQFGDPEVLDGVSVADVCDLARDALLEFARDYVIDEDGLLPPSALEGYLMSALTTTSSRIKHIAQGVFVQGQIVREQRRLAGRVPRSHLAALGSFLLFWFTEEGWEYVRLVTGGENPALECYCLDPSGVTNVVGECWSSIHMSGTLAPLDEYRDSIGLPPETRLRRFRSPFPPENRLVAVVQGLTTKYEILNSDHMALINLKKELLGILLSIERNTAVFFPSHDLLQRFLDLKARVPRPIYVEERGMKQSELMEVVERFRADNAVLFAVYGGRLSEGMDFPARDLEVAVLVGVPYPKPTARQKALVSFYDSKFQRGWEYAVETPARRKLMQAIGRLIRSDTDRGAAIILDNRARRFRDALPDMIFESNYLESAERFFSEGGMTSTSSGELAARPLLASPAPR